MGNLLPTLFPSHFISECDIPNLSGKIILVTGGNSGTGYETVKQLLAKNAKPRGGDKKKRAIFIPLDLADLHSRLDILFNNGGVMSCPPDMLTLQDHDLQFGTNVIGHYFLTELLVHPCILQRDPRVINTSSIGHQMALNAGVELESLMGGPSRDAWLKKNGSFMAPWRLYGESKLGNILVSNYFARVHSEVLVSTAVHPGGIRSKLGRHQAGWFQRLVYCNEQAVCLLVWMGAYTQLWAGTVATPAQITGQYLIPWAKLEAQVIAYIQEQIKEF
ncbi:NAD(P)-binding protein [Mycena rebaudengoi]|nr:NAD(P)-binding protein [Mycena rebaudengoi]